MNRLEGARIDIVRIPRGAHLGLAGTLLVFGSSYRGLWGEKSRGGGSLLRGGLALRVGKRRTLGGRVL